MRQGNNPNKDKKNKSSFFNHHVVIPVYIPTDKGYFKDSFEIFKLCLKSLFKTSHKKTYITIINNGSSNEINTYLVSLYKEKKINELITTENIGKFNAIIKGVSGHKFDLITISDADVLFKPNWQAETINLFNSFPKTGVVGLIPQFKLFEVNCSNILLETLFSNKVKFTDVLNDSDLKIFYKSIGWDENYNNDYLKKQLTLSNKNVSAIIGSGHAIATYRAAMFKKIILYNEFKMGGNSELYLDSLALKYDLWRLTTIKSYASHMGNSLESWFDDEISKISNVEKKSIDLLKIRDSRAISNFFYFLKIKMFNKLFSTKIFRKIYYKLKKLPNYMISNY
ncbi:MAG: glycosyltransferase family A protein [Lutibacter sp.]